MANCQSPIPKFIFDVGHSHLEIGYWSLDIGHSNSLAIPLLLITILRQFLLHLVNQLFQHLNSIITEQVGKFHGVFHSPQ